MTFWITLAISKGIQTKKKTEEAEWQGKEAEKEQTSVGRPVDPIVSHCLGHKVQKEGKKGPLRICFSGK